MKTFTLIGAAGYIAPRHIRAIYALGHSIEAVFDPKDSSSQIHPVFPNALVFTECSLFETHFTFHPTDYVVICSPNHLHVRQISWALQNGADVICEKPLALHQEELDHLAYLEKITGKKVYAILQLRTLDVVINLKNKIMATSASEYEVVVDHIAPRGYAYFKSWKGDDKLSGGILTNIGIHLFDLLIWIFGNVKKVGIESASSKNIRGYLILEKAKVSWFFSVDSQDLPKGSVGFHRKFTINNQEYSLETGLDLLHERVYEQIIRKSGPGIQESRPSIELCNHLKNSII